jgi:hypothetical protein
MKPNIVFAAAATLLLVGCAPIYYDDYAYYDGYGKHDVGYSTYDNGYGTSYYDGPYASAYYNGATSYGYDGGYRYDGYAGRRSSFSYPSLARASGHDRGRDYVRRAEFAEYERDGDRYRGASYSRRFQRDYGPDRVRDRGWDRDRDGFRGRERDPDRDYDREARYDYDR